MEKVRYSDRLCKTSILELTDVPDSPPRAYLLYRPYDCESLMNRKPDSDSRTNGEKFGLTGE